MPFIKFVQVDSGVDDFGNPVSAAETIVGTITVFDEDYQHYQDGIDIKITNNWEYPIEVRRLFVEPVPSFNPTINHKVYVDTETNVYKIIEKKAFDSHLELVLVREL